MTCYAERKQDTAESGYHEQCHASQHDPVVLNPARYCRPWRQREGRERAGRFFGVNWPGFDSWLSCLDRRDRLGCLVREDRICCTSLRDRLGIRRPALIFIDKWPGRNTKRVRDSADLATSVEVAAALGEVVVFDAINDGRLETCPAANVSDTQARIVPCSSQSFADGQNSTSHEQVSRLFVALPSAGF
jgi:hypothetical protein